MDKFIIENSTFLAVSPLLYGGQAMVVASSTVIVTKSHFISFHPGKQHDGGVIYSSNSSVFIFQSVFVNNSAHYGGVFYCQDSKIWIKSSSFAGNSAQRGGVLYCKQKATEATEINSTLHEYLKSWTHNNDSSY